MLSYGRHTDVHAAVRMCVSVKHTHTHTHVRLQPRLHHSDSSPVQDWVIQFGKSCTVNRDWPTRGSVLILTRIEPAAGAAEYQQGV